MKIKAKSSFKDLDDKFFGIHKVGVLLKGGSFEIGDFDLIPKAVQKHLEEVKPKRARNKKGQLVGDDPDTPDINEAYEGGKTPKKKANKEGDK